MRAAPRAARRAVRAPLASLTARIAAVAAALACAVPPALAAELGDAPAAPAAPSALAAPASPVQPVAPAAEGPAPLVVAQAAPAAGSAAPGAGLRPGDPATAPAASAGPDDEDDDLPPPVNDPFEPVNRAVFAFNQKLDDVLVRPLARGYEAVVPPPVRLMIGNVFGNVGDLWVGVNNLLQGKPAEAGQDALRVLVNTTLGMGGIADVATDLGLERHNEDFGQTLGRWGVPSGPYLMLPVFGPSTLRDGSGFALDIQADLSSRLQDPGARNGLRVVKIAHARARLLRADPVFDGIALDRYLFVRDAYLQRRRSLVHDGDPPPDRRR